jgi:hypothetical protein
MQMLPCSAVPFTFETSFNISPHLGHSRSLSADIISRIRAISFLE